MLKLSSGIMAGWFDTLTSKTQFVKSNITADCIDLVGIFILSCQRALLS